MNIFLTRSLYINNMEINEYCMDNGSMSVYILSYGCTLTGICIPSGKDEKKVNILLSFENLESYIHNTLYAGAALGPNAGRISNGILKIQNRHYQLSQNDGNNHIHGGFHNISFQNASLFQQIIRSDFLELTFCSELPDKLDGYPGNRIIFTTYRLTQDNQLSISYRATSDQETYLNLSNHAYFNLSGDFAQNIFSHTLMILADEYIQNNPSHLPQNKRSVTGTPFDFSSPVPIKNNLAKYPNDFQIEIAKGYNHAFLLHKDSSIPSLILKDTNSNRCLELYTDTPSVVLYSGGFIEPGYRLKNGYVSNAHCALAIEPQDVPDTPNLDFLSMKTLKPEETYSRSFTYKFFF